MKVFSILSASVLIASAMADSCNRGGVYCGSSLLRKGKCFIIMQSSQARITYAPHHAQSFGDPEFSIYHGTPSQVCS